MGLFKRIGKGLKGAVKNVANGPITPPTGGFYKRKRANAVVAGTEAAGAQDSSGAKPITVAAADPTLALRKKLGLDQATGSGVQAAVDDTAALTDPAEQERRRKNALRGLGGPRRTMLG